MPIRHFEIFTGERRLIETVAVTQLKGTRLGVDGNYWLRKLLTKEPSLTAMGGVPLTLRSAVEKELEAFKQHHIQPIFVFPGLSLIRKSKPFSIEDTRPSNRATAWDFYDKGKQDAAMSKFATGGGFQLADVLNTVFHILHEHQIEYIRAPYFQWAQLADMYNNPRQVFHAIYGSDELLMFNVDKIITSLDFTVKDPHGGIDSRIARGNWAH
ncbi:PIN domain-like protein [Gongronella butleri]|nr:PIN domain-like protein [Gongronella butleri]